MLLDPGCSQARPPPNPVGEPAARAPAAARAAAAGGPGKASRGRDGATVSLRVRAGVGTDLAELYVVKEGAGDAGEIALLEKSTKGRRASLPALARQSSAFDEAAAWLVREWAEPDVETAAVVTSSARCEVYAAASGTTCDAGGSLPGLPGAVP